MSAEQELLFSVKLNNWQEIVDYCIDDTLYYAMFILLAWLVFGHKPRKVILCIAGSMHLFKCLCAVFFQMHSLYSIINLILIILAFPGVKPRYYVFLFMCDMTISFMLENIVLTFAPSMGSVAYTLSYRITLLGWCCLFISKLRHKLRDLFIATPRWAINCASVVLIVIGIMNTAVMPYSRIPSFVDYDKYIAGVISATSDHVPSIVTEVYEATFIGTFAAVSVLILELMLFFAFIVYMFTVYAKNNLKLQNENFEKQIAVQAEHYRELAAANAEVRRFKHDFKNVRFAIEQFLSDGKKQEALTIMQEFTEALNTNSRTMILFDTGNGIADALLTDKLRQAHQKQTLLTFKGAIPQNALAPTDLCVLLGNTIDNAIEACEKLPPELERKISVECNCSSGFLFLTVRNPVEKPVPICDNRVPSTKKDKALHGFGIQSLHKVAKNYDGLVKLNSDDGFFTVNIDLCLPVMDMTMAG